jgi:y4mF family transcriptional regulator
MSEETTMQITSNSIGTLVRRTRTALGLTQEDLAMASGTGIRFIIELEKGKPTCQLEKCLTVLSTLGVRIDLTPPISALEPYREGRNP